MFALLFKFVDLLPLAESNNIDFTIMFHLDGSFLAAQLMDAAPNNGEKITQKLFGMGPGACSNDKVN